MRPKYAVVREDPEVEAALIEHFGARRALLVASGGCTVLTLARRFPALQITAFDINSTQLDLLRAKCAARNQPGRLNIYNDNPEGLNQNGEFEGLFRVLRHFLQEFVVAPHELDRFFDPGTPWDARNAMIRRWFASPYWISAFALAFDHGLLNAMFGPSATQHAASDSYPHYFQEVFERGLKRADAPQNPFLRHALLGRYLPDCAPEWVGHWPEPKLELVEGTLLDVPGLNSFDLIHLSNIFDWSDDAEVRDWCAHLVQHAQPGAVVLLRQLNNRRNLRSFLSPAFRFEKELSKTLQEHDRSLFYNRIEVAVRTA